MPMNYDEIDNQHEAEIQSGTSALLYQANVGGDSADTSVYYPLKVRTGHHKRLSGFQAETICISPWIDRKTPSYRITSMCYNHHASLYVCIHPVFHFLHLSLSLFHYRLSYGTENSLVIIDLVQKSIVLNVCTSSLYGNDCQARAIYCIYCLLPGTSDPYQRSAPTRSKRCTSAGPHSKDSDANSSNEADRCRSPITDNVCRAKRGANTHTQCAYCGGV